MEINEIKAQLNIIELFTSYGHKPNRNNMVKCPFHEDNKASLVLYPKTNTWHCFGCNKGTDGIDFIQLKENCTVHQAIKGAKVLLKDMQPQAKVVTVPTEPKREITDKERIDTLTKAFTYFVRSTKEEAKIYLSHRQLNIEKLTVGYDGHNFHKAKEVTAELKELYLETGLIYPDKLGRVNNFHCFFDNCLVFPTFNQKGEIVNLYGRCIDDTKENKHRYLKGKHQGIYPHYPKSETERLIITEKIIDTATLLSLDTSTVFERSGLKSCSLLSLYGTNNFTEEMQTAIKDLKKLKEIILFFDGDKAGQGAIDIHGTVLQSLLPKVKISYVETPENEDINSLAQSYTENTAEYITELLNNRKAFGTAQQETFILQEEKTRVFEDQTVVQGEQEAPQEQAKQNPVKGKTSVQENSQLTASVLNTHNPDQLIFRNSWLTASVWGGIDFQNLKKLRTTLHLQSIENEYLDYRDTIDLYSNANTQKLIREASEQLGIGTTTMTKTVSELTKSLEKYRESEREKQRQIEAEKNPVKLPKVLTEMRKQELKQLLESENLYTVINDLIGKTGVIGEEKNRMIMWTVYTSRLMATPLHIVCLGSSGTGKTYLQDSISDLIPELHKVNITTSTEQALYYIGRTEYKHKLIIIEDMDGVNAVLLAIRELQTKQIITRLVPWKDPNGNMKTILLVVEGPICLSGTTTQERMYEDNANRCILIYLDNSKEHQGAILQRQRNTSAGLIDRVQEEQTKELLRDLQEILRPINVVNPYANHLIIPQEVFKPLRTNAHYLQFIESVTFVHQYQREIKKDKYGVPYIETTLGDIELANDLLKDVLLAKSDELTKACRDFLESLKTLLSKQNKESFFRSDIRDSIRINPDNLRYYLSQLNKYGYIKIVGGNKHKGGYEYEISDKDEYSKLSNSIETALDKALQALKDRENKKKDNGSDANDANSCE